MTLESFGNTRTYCIRCDCGRGRVILSSSWANECPCCGQEYNGSGQALAPREHWGRRNWGAILMSTSFYLKTAIQTLILLLARIERQEREKA